MGNWSQFDQSGTSVPTVPQDRQTNSQNQITSYDNASEQSTSDWAVPVYDAAGNMTTTPQPGARAHGLICTYDAWDRLVNVTGQERDENCFLDKKLSAAVARRPPGSTTSTAT